MESPNIVKTFNQNPTTHQPIVNVMETSVPYRSFAQNNRLVRDTSFSSYLKPEEHKPASVDNIEELEISIFDAQKYFSEGNDQRESTKVSPALNSNGHLDASAVSRLSSVSSADGYVKHYRIRSFHASTPTASSEASWNSQTGLLSNPSGSFAVSMSNVSADRQEKKRGGSIATKWFLGRRCPCSGKKSVQVEESAASQPRTPADSETNNSRANSYTKRQIIKQLSAEEIVGKVSMNKPDKSSLDQRVIPNPRRVSFENDFPTYTANHQLQRGPRRPFTDNTGAFSFPILNPSSPVKVVLKKPLPPQSTEDPPRESLDVFQPVSGKSSPEIQQRVLASRNFPGSPISRVTATDEDAASDASSDLFEIENFSAPYRRRDSLDEASISYARRCRQSLYGPTTPTECYEPSEASIDWSVTTGPAEGFDRNFSVSEDVAEKGGGTATQDDGGEKRKGNGLLLLSCRHEKSVSVGPIPVKCGPPEGRHVGPALSSISAVGHVNGGPASTGKSPLARSHSAHLSLAFAA